MIGWLLLGLAAAVVVAGTSSPQSTNGSGLGASLRPRRRHHGDAGRVEVLESDSPEVVRLKAELGRLEAEGDSLERQLSVLDRDLVAAKANVATVHRDAATLRELRVEVEELFRSWTWCGIAGAVAVAVGVVGVTVVFAPLGWLAVGCGALGCLISVPALVSVWARDRELCGWEREVTDQLGHGTGHVVSLKTRRAERARTLVRLREAMEQRRRALARQCLAARERERIAQEATMRRVAQEGAERQKAARLTAIVQGALVWWSSQLPQADQFVEAHWRELISSEKTLLAQYTDPANPCSTMEACFEIARWALCERRSELGYHLSESQLSVEALALLLRWHHGFAVEYLLPQARAVQLRRLLTPRRKPRPLKRIEPPVAELPPHQPTPAPAPAPTPAPTPTSPLEEFYAGLPARIREDLKGFDRHFEKVQTREQLERFKQAYAETRRTEFEASGRRAELIEEDMEALDYNLDQAIKAWARSRGLK